MGESIGIYRKFKVRYYSIINVYGHIRITLKINFMFNDPQPRLNNDDGHY